MAEPSRSAHPALRDIISQVQIAGIDFYDALDISKEAALQGVTLAQDFVSFWDGLTDENFSTEELQKYLNDMKQEAEFAHITNEIPIELDCLTNDEKYYKDKIAGNEKTVRHLKVAKVVASTCAAVVGVVAGVTFPPAFIALPIVLPLLTLVLEGAQMRIEKKIEEREVKLCECKDAITRLNHVAEDLIKLEHCVDQFALFWEQIKENLSLVDRRLHDLRRDRNTRLRLNPIKNSFQKLEGSLSVYNAKLEFLKFYDPRTKFVQDEGSIIELDPHTMDEPLSLASPSVTETRRALQRRHALKRRKNSNESLSSQTTLVEDDEFSLRHTKPRDRSSRSGPSDSNRPDHSNAPQDGYKPLADKDCDSYGSHDDFSRSSKSKDRSLLYRSKQPRLPRDDERYRSSRHPRLKEYYDSHGNSSEDERNYDSKYRSRPDRREYHSHRSDPATWMPPKKRVRKNDTIPVASEDSTPKPPLPPDANTGIVFDLPSEIWLEILSYFTSVRIPTLRLSCDPLLPPSTLERHEALRALSQTCSKYARRKGRGNIRRRLHHRGLHQKVRDSKPMRVIEKILNAKEVPGKEDDDSVTGAWYKNIAEALETRSNGLRNSPEHAKLVQ
ncbi:hypothetical protein H0H87_012130 [Tephrocybe sp. NHM501043]|nr:hypothetical protein H0H87_012130 [Tephrocybe sp. NHM501043]